MKTKYLPLVCMILPLWAQERHFTRGLTVSSEVELSSALGPVRAEVRQTGVHFHNGLRDSTGSLLTIFEPKSRLLYWSYAEGAIPPGKVGTITHYRHPRAEIFLDKHSLSNIVVYPGEVRVLVSTLRATGVDEALQMAALGLDGYVEAVRSRNFDVRPGVGWPKRGERPVTVLLPDELRKGIPFYGLGGFDVRPPSSPSLESVSRVGASLHLTLKGFHGDIVVVALDPLLIKATLVSDGRKGNATDPKELEVPKP